MVNDTNEMKRNEMKEGVVSIGDSLFFINRQKSKLIPRVGHTLSRDILGGDNMTKRQFSGGYQGYPGQQMGYPQMGGYPHPGYHHMGGYPHMGYPHTGYPHMGGHYPPYGHGYGYHHGGYPQHGHGGYPQMGGQQHTGYPQGMGGFPHSGQTQSGQRKEKK
jgi:hypothetical protein